jgi:hypothetical protein
MPIISTRAAMSAYGFGFTYTLGEIGTFGVFRYTQAQTSKYVFATGATSVATNADYPVGYSPMVFGTASVGYFAAWVAGTLLTKYTFASDVVSLSAANPVSMTSGYACGNAALAILNAASTSAVKFTYASESFSAGSSFSFSIVSGAAAGNSVQGVFGRGSNSTICSLYEYASDAQFGLSALVLPLYMSGAVSTATFGLFFCGQDASTLKYSFSEQTSIAATPLLGDSTWAAAAGNAEMAVTTLNRNSADTNIYMYSSDTVTAGTALAAGSGQVGPGVSNGTTGVNV